MKIQCDVCNKDEASLFCVADEAALCVACDHSVHHANKLACNHHRFSLLQQHSPYNHAPLCDICQERKAFLFCQQDRALLCRECDLPIHKVNEHTRNHNRFLFTGVKLSENSALYSSTTFPAAACSANSLLDFKSQNPTTISAAKDKGGGGGSQVVNVDGYSLTSSISEYIQMLPGWHVEEFLDSSTPTGFCKIVDNDVFPYWDTDVDSHLSAFSPESMGILVPQVPFLQSNQQIQTQFCHLPCLDFDGQNGFKDSIDITSIKSIRKWRDDNSFAVPQINQPSTSFKRIRTLF